MQGLIIFLVCLLLSSGEIRSSSNSTYCAAISPPVPPCPTQEARDLLFLVDTSNSMNRVRFYSTMLDYTQSLYCAFDPRETNQAGMILFAQNVYVRIPLGPYSQDEWFSQVETVRSDDTACCSCCTPTAEAFDLASQEFQVHGKNTVRIAFVITDGVPSNNDPNTGGEMAAQ